MTQAKFGDTVTVHYTGKLEDGRVFDSSFDREPLVFTLGENHVIPGFEEAVVGMDQGDSITATVPADKAYGPRRPDMMIDVEREQLPPGMEPQVGQQLEVRQESGHTRTVVIADVQENAVTLDANHPLAGEDLIFEIKLLEIGGNG
jgi:peptidylprolyl isomerase